MGGSRKEETTVGVLSKVEIVRRVDAGPLEERSVITPLLQRSQIGGTSVDLRLGFAFVLPRRANMPGIDPLTTDGAIRREKYQERLTLSRGGLLHLHPGEFVLGATLEYVRLPNDVSAYVTSRSSWGRAGLVIATAIAVAPGFRGVITLELANLGSVPLTLRPGVRIAQIVFHQAGRTETYEGRYNCPTGPEFGKVHLDEELPFWLGPASAPKRVNRRRSGAT